MTETIYPRDRVEQILERAELPASYRIIPRRYLATPLGTTPGDSRFCAKADGFTILYASPDFGTTFFETIARDRLRRMRRKIRLKEVTEQVWVLMTTKPRVKLRLLDLPSVSCI